MTEHTCHWPGCSTAVPPRMWGCQPHWYRLPKALRDRIWQTYRPGQEISKTPSCDYVAAAREVQEWIAGQQPATHHVEMRSRQVGRTDEAHRRECEARQWIREGYFDRDRVEALMERITKHRGAEAADALRREMRRQWTLRAEWMEPQEP